MKYDDASWHYGGNFPKELPPEAAVTHIGMFVSWCWLNGMIGDEWLKVSQELLERITSRSSPPGGLFIELCGEKFVAAQLNDEGNAFARDYYDFESKGFRHKYYNDLEKVMPPELPSLYHMTDSWGTFEKIQQILDERFKEWRKSRETEN